MSNTVVMDSGVGNATPPVEQPGVETVETKGGVQFTGDTGENKAERPAWLPEKFQSPEALAEAYKALEGKLGSSTGSNRIQTEATKPPAAKGSEEELSFAPAIEEFQKDGAVSEKTYKQFAAKGLSKSAVDSFIAGQQALAERQTADLASAVGGNERLTTILEWAGKNLTPAEMEGYNSQIDAGNIEAAKIMLGAFGARFDAKNGADPKLANGATAASQNEGGFQSQGEMLTAMRDPRYQSDSAYRAMVTRRLAKTTAF